MTKETNHCPQCGTALSADAPAGNCPVCLMGLAMAPAASASPGPASPTASSRFGDYDLGAPIGAGGMGTVYRARQISLNRTVALKLIRAGGFASDRDHARFQTEAEAAASLDHPHIVPVYDFGEWEGWRYLSMRLVDGRTLAQEMPRYQADPRAGTTLLAQVARAVHYAHQRGILHRDLKPSNILVDSNGQPQVTDFGLAKRLDQAGGITLTGQMVGTPAYMAPEQAQGDAKRLSTAADVYSLGVLLYEMLAGEVPFSAATPLEILRQVVETEPRRPSALRPKVDAELETVALRCLDKNPQRRYGSAEALAEELERWLRHEPILARRSGVISRAVKWSRRRPTLAVLLAVLLVGALVSTWQAVRATRAEQGERQLRAEAETGLRQEAELIEEILRHLNGLVLQSRTPEKIRPILTAVEQRASLRYQGYAEVEGRIRLGLGRIYRELWDFPTASARTREALDLYRRAFGLEHEEVASVLSNLADALSGAGDLPGAEAAAREAVAMSRKLLGETNADTAVAINNLSTILFHRNDLRGAETNLLEVLAIQRQVLSETNAEIALTLANLAKVRSRLGDLPAAVSTRRQALELYRQVNGTNHIDVALNLNDLALDLQRQRQFAQAEATAREALAITRRLFGENHTGVAILLEVLTANLRGQGKLDEIESLQRRALAIRRTCLGDENPDTATSCAQLASTLETHGQLAEAESLCREALAARRKAFGQTNRVVADSLRQLTGVLQKRGQTNEAERLQAEAALIAPPQPPPLASPDSRTN